VRALRLGRVVTEEFRVSYSKKGKLASSPGLEYLTKMLVRASCHEVLIPAIKTGSSEYLSYNTLLGNKIRQVDSHLSAYGGSTQSCC
jgi:hypothetical protein